VQDDLDAITAGLDAFEQLVMGKEPAARSHVGAGVALSQLAKDLWRVVTQPHVNNRYRFRDAAASMAAWLCASGIRVGGRERVRAGGRRQRVAAGLSACPPTTSAAAFVG
jgi:hypothetical protein